MDHIPSVKLHTYFYVLLIYIVYRWCNCNSYYFIVFKQFKEINYYVAECY